MIGLKGRKHEMNLLFCLSFILFSHLANALGSKTVCFYDADGVEREGLAKFSLMDLEIALDYCTHLVYGYVGLEPDTFRLTSLNTQRDVKNRHYLKVTDLKEKFPYVKILLSVGGDKDMMGDSAKYIQLLEGGREKQQNFIDSANYLVRSLNFDGLDLAFQLPRNKPRKVHSAPGMTWKSVKKIFSGDFVVDANADEHKRQMTDLITKLKKSFNENDLLLSLTVLPNVNSSWYFNVPALINQVDFVNLATFDFTTPECNPHEADYTAPLYAPTLEGNRLPHYNIDHQIAHWTSERFPRNKIHLGIATYGRAWKMTPESKDDGFPIISATAGAAEPGPQIKKSGLLSYPEICLRLQQKSEHAIRSFADPTKKFGTYAFRAADGKGEHGVWVSYDGSAIAGTKAAYAATKSLGGVAVFDLTLDDFRGQCSGETFQLLKAINYNL